MILQHQCLHGGKCFAGGEHRKLMTCLPALHHLGTAPALTTKRHTGLLNICATRIAPRLERFVAHAEAAAASAVPAPVPEPSLMDRLKKILPLGCIFLCATFNYTILQTLKDSLIVTQVGAEALPFLGAYGVLPVNIAFFAFYSWLIKTVPEKTVFYLALAPFIAFYSIFALVLYPNAAALQPTYLIEGMMKVLPSGLAGLAKMLGCWLFSLFFAIAETWGGVVISVLFWGLANEVCTMAEAREVYPRLGIIANLGVVAAGFWVKHVNKNIACGDALMSMRILVATICAMTCFMFANKAYVDNRFLSAPRAAGEEKPEGGKKKKDKGKPDAGVWEFVKKSQKTRDLGVLVVAYFVTAKLFDYGWKAQMRVICPTPSAFQAVMGDIFQLTGFTTIFLMTISGFIFKKFGWLGGALASPGLMFASGTMFFASALVSQGLLPLPAQIAAMVLSAGYVAGIVTRIFTKSSKYSLFDPSKEMVYISMDKDEKKQGKAAVDMLASSFGKSGASWLAQALMLIFGNFTVAMPAVAVLYITICLAWMGSTMNLGKQMKSTDEQAQSGVVKDAQGDGVVGARKDAGVSSSILSVPPPPPPVVAAATTLTGVAATATTITIPPPPRPVAAFVLASPDILPTPDLKVAGVRVSVKSGKVLRTLDAEESQDEEAVAAVVNGPQDAAEARQEKGALESHLDDE